LEYYIQGLTNVLRFDDIIDFDFSFDPKEFKEGILTDKVSGDARFCILMQNPRFYYEIVLEKDVKAKAKKSLFGRKVTYEHPKKMLEFEKVFIETYIANLPDIDNTAVEDIKKAMTLFMIDDLGVIDINGLIETRDSLLASFQNGNCQKQINKINSAFDLLKDKVGK